MNAFANILKLFQEADAKVKEFADKEKADPENATWHNLKVRYMGVRDGIKFTLREMGLAIEYVHDPMTRIEREWSATIKIDSLTADEIAAD